MMGLPKDIKKIAVFRALQLGDMLCVIPAIRALRAAYPQAEIILLGLPWAKSFTQRFSKYFNGFIHFPGYEGLPEQPFDTKKFEAFLSVVKQEKFDLVLQMQGNGTIVNEMVEQFGAKYTAGFSTKGHYAPDNGLFLPYPDFGSEIERHILLMQHLGIEGQETELEFPLTAKDYNEFNSLKINIEPRKYVCIHPGSRGSYRQWPTKYFATLADYCAQRGYKVVVTGTNDEIAIVNEVITKMKYKAINLAGKTSLGAVGALINNAALLISNCTGVSHIAAALKTPSIVISMDGEPHRWGPLNKKVHRTIDWLRFPDFHLVFQDVMEILG
jgi:ADP-heptose:LPS heptosyltransferase